jgi:hypothetical protein
VDAVPDTMRSMDKPVPGPPEESFVIRISAEDARVSPGGWRATVIHVASRERRYVNSYGELCAFIDARRPAARG